MARVLIAGCGYVGSALGERLAADGHEVWGLRRNPDSLPPGVRPLAADLLAPDTLVLPPGLDFVFYTAAPDQSGDAGYRAAYVDGVRNTLAALRGAGQSPRRVFFTSSTGVYAQSGGEWVDESSPTEPETFSGRRVLEGERILLGGLFPATILRLGGIYGPGRTRLIDEVRGGTASLPGDPPSYSNRIHRDDCAGALRHLMGLPEPEAVYVGVDREPTDLAEILLWLARRLDAPAPAAGEGTPPRRTRNRSNKRCSSARLVASGYRFLFSTYREGFEALLTDAAG